MTQQFSYPKDKIKVLLLENIHPSACSSLKEDGYNVQVINRALGEDELCELIADIHVLGIRSKTKVTKKVIDSASKLLCVGCFGIGTNQVDLTASRIKGVPVFNAPYSSTRSVAELAVSYILMLLRGVGFRNNKMHLGLWEKSSKGCHEIRHKTLGILGYGHIGAQVGLMAESLGMKVLYFDMMKKLPLGTAKACSSMDELLANSDFVSVHIPAKSDGTPVIGESEFKKMKNGSYLINLSRGSVVDLPILKEFIENGELGGAALDVFPVEPKSNNADFKCELMGLDNVIMTPHIGGSTEEAQENIGLEVASSFINFIDNGTTTGAVNFPSINLPSHPGSNRILNVHKNIPGVLNSVNAIIAELGANINAQYLSTFKEVGYLIMDLNKDISNEVKQRIENLESNIKTRILY